MPDLTGSTAVVTGASSGIGLEMAKRLARWKCSLVLTARRLDKLEALGEELRAASGVQVDIIREDLADRAGPERLYRSVAALGRPVDILINNAGFGAYQMFVDTPWPQHIDMLQLNIQSLVELTYRFLPDMLARGTRAHILNVASTAAYVAVPHFATYTGSKCFVLGFSESLATELRRSEVKVTCLSPGSTATEFFDVAGQTLGAAARAGTMSAERCASIGLRGMLRGKRTVVPGGTNKMIEVASRLLPGSLLSRAGGKIIGSPNKLISPPDNPAPDNQDAPPIG